jgi:hypothetical protein
MRTTIDLPDHLFRELKALAAMRGMSMKQILQEAVADELANANKRDMVRERVKFPLIKSKQPGTLHLTNADIEDLLT